MRLNQAPPTIELGGGTYPLPCNLNVVEQICERFGDIGNVADAIGDAKGGIGAVKWLLTVIINEGLEIEGQPPLSEKQIGRMLCLADVPELQEKIFAAITAGMPKNAVEDAKNVAAAQMEALTGAT